MKDRKARKLTRDLPSFLGLVELLSLIRRDTYDDITLDGTEGEDRRSTGFRSERTDSHIERSRRRSVTIVSELAVVEISLEDDEIGIGEVKEEIGSWREERNKVSLRKRENFEKRWSSPSLLSSQNCGRLIITTR